MPARITAATVAAVAVLAPVLVGCGGSADPGPKSSSGTTESTTPITSSDPPTTTSPTTTKPTGPVEPSYPDAAKANTRNGARAFARYYIAVASYAQVTGDTKTLKKVAADTCFGCARLVSRISDIYKSGGWIRSKPLMVLSLNAAHEDGLKFRLDLAVRFPNQYLKQRRGEKPKLTKGAREPLVLHLIWKGSRWLVYASGG